MTAIPKGSNGGESSEEGQADPLLDEIRSIKRSIAQRFDHDVRKLGAHLMQSQEANRERLVFRKPSDKP